MDNFPSQWQYDGYHTCLYCGTPISESRHYDLYCSDDCESQHTGAFILQPRS